MHARHLLARGVDACHAVIPCIHISPVEVRELKYSVKLIVERWPVYDISAINLGQRNNHVDSWYFLVPEKKFARGFIQCWLESLTGCKGPHAEVHDSTIPTTAIACKPDAQRTFFEIMNLKVCFSRERPFKSSKFQRNDRQETATSGHSMSAVRNWNRGSLALVVPLGDSGYFPRPSAAPLWLMGSCSVRPNILSAKA